MLLLRAGTWADQTPLSNFIFLLMIAIAGLIYIIPSVIAFVRNHPQKLPIAALNIFGGWAGVTWLFALVWAVQNLER